MRHVLPVLALLLSAGTVYAQQDGCGGGDPFTDRFAAYQDNYVLYNQMRNNGWTERDEAALRVQLSFKYSVAGCPVRIGEKQQKKEVAEAIRKDWELYVAFTMQFDFYLGSRPSGPVVVRRANPGLHWRMPGRWFEAMDPDGRARMELSVEHLSDGQTFEPTDVQAGGPALAARRYERGDHAFFDTLSRDINYVGLQWRQPFSTIAWWAPREVLAKTYGYFRTSTDITWGPLAGQGLSIANYERLTLRGSWELWNNSTWQLTWHLGDSGMKHDSFDLTYEQKFGKKGQFNVFVFAHAGPLNTLSNYTQRQDSLGIGFRFTDF